MDATLSLVLAFGFGVGLTVNAAITGAMTRARGVREASLLTPVSALPIIAILLAWVAYSDGSTKLPVPFEASAAMLALVVVSVPLLWLVVRGAPLWCGAAGFLNGLGLVFVPRFVDDLGLGCRLAGDGRNRRLWCAVEHEVSLLRVFGVVLVAAGVVAVRTGK